MVHLLWVRWFHVQGGCTRGAPGTNVDVTPRAANPAERLTAKVRSEVRSDAAQYEHGEERPLKGYLALLGTYGSLVGTLAATIRWRHSPLPDRIPPYDLALISVATHKAARV